MLPDDMDKECISLCEAMNKLSGIYTTSSCCGHGKEPYRIWFRAVDLESLPPLLYWFDHCHCGFCGWNITVYTDCAMAPVTFLAEGPVGAFREAERIAEIILDSITDN